MRGPASATAYPPRSSDYPGVLPLYLRDGVYPTATLRKADGDPSGRPINLHVPGGAAMSTHLFTIGLLASIWASGATAAAISYRAFLDGPSESPAVPSPGTGVATATYDDASSTLFVAVAFSGLVGDTTVAHIHCCVAVPGEGTIGVATQTPTFTGFPAGVKAGAYAHLFDLDLTSSFNAAFVSANGGTAVGARAALIDGMNAGRAYFNIHTTFAGGGEIRGFLAVPEPGSLALLCCGICMVALRARRGPGTSRWRVRD